VLSFHGQTYGLSAGGLDYGSSSVAPDHVAGRVRNIHRAQDIAGVYGARASALRWRRRARHRADQPNGAILELSGKQLD